MWILSMSFTSILQRPSTFARVESVQRNGDGEARTAFHGTVHSKCAAQQKDALLNPKQPQVSWLAAGADHLVHVKAAPVVFDAERDLAVKTIQAHPGVARSGVLNNVVDAFLRDAEQRRLQCRRKALAALGRLDGNLNPSCAHPRPPVP